MATKKSSGPAAPARTLGETDAHKLTLIRMVVEAIASRAAEIDLMFFYECGDLDTDGLIAFQQVIRRLVANIGALADYGSVAFAGGDQAKGGVEAWLMHPVFRSELARGAEEVQHG